MARLGATDGRGGSGQLGTASHQRLTPVYNVRCCLLHLSGCSQRSMWEPPFLLNPKKYEVIVFLACCRGVTIEWHMRRGATSEIGDALVVQSIRVRI
jgi:hypothetical protein